jgi:16S rRNA (adenine1518-N6/adenine1519-N6)-dimethyltransferase
MYQSKAKKSFGQHFLSNRKYAERIVEAIDPKPGDNVLEIGPGKGALTKILLEKRCLITAIEYDQPLAAFLENELADNKNLKILAGDFLDIGSRKFQFPLKIIGNIPYNITKEILDKLFEFKNILICAVLTVQTEIAQKLVAKPSAKDYGLLTLMVKSSFDARILFGVPRKVFSPPPKVTSKTIKLIPVSSPVDNLPAFREFLSGCYKQKRKTLANSMQFGLTLPKSNCESFLKQAGLATDIRPEQLTLDEYAKLFRLWQELA